ncbi:hypothetical protein HHL19_15990 [Streptomyces sp. R302]|uniref:hypothetical protein n=1 Tax=unclassified Streptomyces TaxID=2593676 RepID=UPI00145F9D69|nr:MULTISPECIES: hypothetical protein [unclassified Streptomyces]NML51568.1 hypothetical protein [Streptomyces sp. R301]NML80146.1 hypothetical protein [Streptomyces sp. R302]
MRVPTQRTQQDHRSQRSQRPRKGARRAIVALVATCAAGAVATPIALAAASAERAPAAAAGDDRLLPTPEAARISDGSYAGFQFCGGPAGDPVVTTGTPTLAATLESVAPPGTSEPTRPGPRRKVAFEVDTAAGKPVLHRQLTSDTSHQAALQLPEGTLADGAYRWRVRVKDGATSSGWTAWCSFTVKRG